jgi:hypothetical protein
MSGIESRKFAGWQGLLPKLKKGARHHGLDRLDAAPTNGVNPFSLCPPAMKKNGNRPWEASTVRS